MHNCYQVDLVDRLRHTTTRLMNGCLNHIWIGHIQVTEVHINYVFSVNLFDLPLRRFSWHGNNLRKFSKYNQQDATFHNWFISVRRCTWFRRFSRPSSRVQNYTYSVRHLSDRYCYLLLAAVSSNGLTNTWRCMCTFELLTMDGKTVWNM